MFVERLLCKCMPLPIRHLQSTRQLCLGQTRTARKKLQIEKELTLTTVKHFMGLFECSEHHAYKILNKHKTLRDIQCGRLETVVQLCGKLGIERQEILDNPDVLAILPVTIENHSMLLEESGFARVAAHSLVNYIPILKKRISLLKAYGYIPPNTNVPESFLSHLEPEIQEIGLQCKLKDSELSVMAASVLVLGQYLAWRLRAEPKQIEAMFKTYHRLRHKSLRLLRRTLDLLELDIGFSKEKIVKNGFLIHSNPQNIELMLKEVETLGKVPIRTLLLKYPKIMSTPVNTIKKTLKHFVDFGITDEAVQKCPEIFTLGSDTIYERLSNLKVVPEFSVLLSHPRILRLVYYQKKAQTRLEYLHELRVKCVSLHILSGPEFLFEKYAKDGADKTKGTDISHFLGQELEHNEQCGDREYRDPQEKIRSSLTRHPYWCHVPLTSVRETMDFLLQTGFSKKQIIASIQIVLYPKDRVARELAILSSHPELSDQQLLPLRSGWIYDANKSPSASPFVTSSRSDDASSSSDSDDSDSDKEEVVTTPPSKISLTKASVRSLDPSRSLDGRLLYSSGHSKQGTARTLAFIEKDFQLQLCMYFIEKEHHFTGNGIWTHSQSVEGFQSEVVSHSPLTQLASYKQRVA